MCEQFLQGRARAPKAHFYLLVDEDTESDFKRKLDIIKGIESVRFLC